MKRLTLLFLTLSTRADCLTNGAALAPEIVNAVPVAMTTTNNAVHLEWIARPGHYAVEYSGSLAGPWFTLAFYNVQTNAVLTQDCPILACAPSMFFRVRSN